MDLHSMSAWKTVWLSLGQVWNNKRAFLKIFGPWMLIQFVMGVVLIVALGGTFLAQDMGSRITMGALGFGAIVLFIAVLVVSILAYVIPAIGWHRFILNHEYDDSYLVWRNDFRPWGYVWYLFKLGLMIGIPSGIVIAIVSVTSATAPDISFVALGVGALFLVFIVFPFSTRLQIALAGIATKRPMHMREALSITKGKYWFFFGLIWCLLLAAIIISIPFTLLSSVAEFSGLYILAVGLDLLNIIPDLIITATAVGIISNTYARFTGNPAAVEGDEEV